MDKTDSYKKFGTTDLFMVLALVLWALNFSFVKIALREFSPMGFNGIRLSFVSLVFILILIISKEGLSIPKSDVWKFALLGLCGNTIYQLFFIHGIELTSASNSSIIIAMSPAFVALLSSLVKHERLNWAAWLGIIISFMGFYFVISKQSGGFEFSWEFIKGDVLIFLGCLFWTCYTVFSRPFLDKISPMKLTALTVSMGTVFYLPFCVKDVLRIHPAEISFTAWASLFFSGFFAMVIGYIIWYSSVKRIGNSKTAVYDYLLPVFTVIFAYILLKERISLLQAAGALIIFAGVYLTRSGYRIFEKKSKN